MSKRKCITTEIENHDGLLCYTLPNSPNPEIPTCLGHLLYFPEHGVFDATFGKLSIDPSLVDEHNRLLDEAIVRGLEKCPVGVWGTLYLKTEPNGLRKVITFTGIPVSDGVGVSVTRNTIVFTFQGMTFQGRIEKDSDVFNFRRTA